jgi:rod shape-determining protein MreC
VILMTVDHRLHQLDALRSALSTIVSPLLYLVDLPATTGRWLGNRMQTRDQLLSDNIRLREQQTLLEARLQKFAALQAENIRLKQLLGSSVRISERVLIAQILAVDMDPNRHQIVLNKGSRNGVFVGQPLLDAAGVVGQILHVGPVTSTAILITDPNHALPVQVNRNGLRTIALGTGMLTRLELPHLPNNADIEVGDLLITSGLGGHFPPDYPVGSVSEVVKDAGLPFAQVVVTPSAHLDRSREVLLVLPTEAQTTGPAAEAADPAAASAPTATPPEVAP